MKDLRPMKTERVTLLTTPEFKIFLTAEAKREGVSVAELVRSRVERRRDPDEEVLVALTEELKAAVLEARKSLHAGMAEMESVLKNRPAATAAPKSRDKRNRKSSARVAA
jgi:hypothetical protein